MGNAIGPAGFESLVELLRVQNRGGTGLQSLNLMNNPFGDVNTGQWADFAEVMSNNSALKSLSFRNCRLQGWTCVWAMARVLNTQLKTGGLGGLENLNCSDNRFNIGDWVASVGRVLRQNAATNTSKLLPIVRPDPEASSSLFLRSRAYNF